MRIAGPLKGLRPLESFAENNAANLRKTN